MRGLSFFRHAIKGRPLRWARTRRASAATFCIRVLAARQAIASPRRREAHHSLLEELNAYTGLGHQYASTSQGSRRSGGRHANFLMAAHDYSWRDLEYRGWCPVWRNRPKARVRDRATTTIVRLGGVRPPEPNWSASPPRSRCSLAPGTLRVPPIGAGLPIRRMVAARIGRTRLIDNVGMRDRRVPKTVFQGTVSFWH
jgi:hypothetical protein